MRLRRLLFAALLTFGCGHTQVPLPAFAPAVSGTATAERGESIVRDAAVCGQCHAADPHNPDGPLSGGMEFHDWRIGVARAANLTSDVETGLGSWSEAEIVRALRNGERKDGRLLAPVMPYEWFHEMSDDDALAVARYLKTLPPVTHAIRQSPNLMFKLGKALFLRPKSAVSISAPPRGATAGYGAYVSQHVGRCAECHTPLTGIRSLPDKSRLFAGMAHPPKDFPAKPLNLTPDSATGIGRWSEGDFLQVIRTGKKLDGASLNPYMPWQQIRRMSDDDLRAIYRYLRTIPAVRNDQAPATQPAGK